MGVHLAIAGLQAVERTLLDRKLKVLDFMVMSFKLVAQVHQFPVQARHLPGHRRHWLWRPDTGYNILTLSIHQVLPEHDVLASTRIPGKSHACGGVIAHVAKYHLHDIYGGTIGHLRCDPEFTPVVDSPFGTPGIEYCLNRNLQLLAGV